MTLFQFAVEQISQEVDIAPATGHGSLRGPGLDGWRAMLVAAGERLGTPKGKRDLALIRLMHDLGLRRGEVIALDLAHVDLAGLTLAVIGKGRSERTHVTLNAPAAAALLDWMTARGDWPGPLFIRLDHAALPPTRLDAGNAARASKSLGLRAGLSRGTNPHGLRHQGITRALDLAGGRRETGKTLQSAR